jgi:hypothetical protein
MVIDCKLSKADMSEAVRLNLSGGFWFATVLRSLRIVMILGVVVIAAAVKLLNHDTKNWQPVGILLGVGVLFVALYIWRITNSIRRTAARVNTACDRMTIDGQGLTTANAAGSTTFTPWSQVHKWKEGKQVFTIGDAKLFRTIPKSGLSEMQIGELRGILQSQIR